MSRSHTPLGSVPAPNEGFASRGYGNSGVADFAQGNPSATVTSPLAQSAGGPGQFYENFEAGTRGSSIVDEPHGGINRSSSTASTAVAPGQAGLPSRNNTLKKKSSMRRTGSLKRSSSRKSLTAGSIKGVSVSNTDDSHDFNSAFHTPIPTQGTPTEVLANRFQAWRQLLKSLIAYFREIQTSYETRAKAISKVQHVIQGIQNPSVFYSDRGLGEATRILDDYHKHSVTESNKSREIENDVIGALSGLRSDLGQKIKEIKGLSGDFKNSVAKEQDGTRREVEKLQEALQHADHEDGSATGKSDPYVVRLGVDGAVEKQIDEENYLHRAYLNLEASGRELESIVVGEIQKAYNALAGILKREGDDAYSVVESLRSGPISMPKDEEWSTFVNHDPHFVSPNIPLRRIEDISYPGKDHPAATEIRAGMLERKSKYLKSYTPGWYVLSPTHLHEFKSADKIYSQPPVMSLYLPDQRLGSHSETGSSSAKFMLKGKQAGGMHKGHSWVFRAESHDTMLAWFQDIKILTEKTGEERNAFVRSHARSVSGNSNRPRSVSSDGLDEDEDEAPYAADAASLAEQNPVSPKPQRPLPGGRFPSDLNVNRHATMSPSSNDSSSDVLGPAAALPGTSYHPANPRTETDPYRLRGVESGSRGPSAAYAPHNTYDEDQQRYMNSPQEQQNQPLARQDYSQPAAPMQTQSFVLPMQPQQQPASMYQQQAPMPQQYQQPAPITTQQTPYPEASDAMASPDMNRHTSTYGDWLGGAAVGAGAGALGTEAYRRHQQDATVPQPDAAQNVKPTPLNEAPPVMAPTGMGENGDPALQRSVEPTTNSLPPADTTAIPAAALAGNVAPSAGQNGMNPSTIPATSTAHSAGLVGNSSLGDTGSRLGGLESRGAHETGHIFPSVVRHNTDMSISGLHVPGEFPKRS